MSAVVVEQVYKKFGKPGEPFWKRILPEKLKNNDLNGQNGKNGGHLNQDNGHGAAAAGTLPTPAQTSGNGKAKGPIIAVNYVSFTVAEGETFGVLGPNGGGKSTLIRLISTLLLPDSGKIYVFGYDVEKYPMRVQKIINRVSVEASFFKKLSPMENLLYGARLYGQEGSQTRRQVLEILARLGLEKRSIYSPMEEMSRGMQQKVAIARALLTKPELMLLDEPTTGLDPRSKREVQAIVRELRETNGTTILLTTHDMNEAELLCDRIAIMDSGKVVALDTPTALKQSIPARDGREATLEEVFLELTGKKLVSPEEENEV